VNESALRSGVKKQSYPAEYAVNNYAPRCLAKGQAMDGKLSRGLWVNFVCHVYLCQSWMIGGMPLWV